MQSMFPHFSATVNTAGKGRYRQALYSYKLKFAFDDDNLLSYLSGRAFQARDIKLLDDYKEKKFK